MAEIGPVFLTGASGFVGRHIVRKLCSNGIPVRALVRRPPAQPLDPSVELVIGSLSEPDSYLSALAGAKAVIHAALTDNLSDEPQATAELLHRSARQGVRKMIHLSSIAVYGAPESGSITEETPPAACSDAYSRTKLAIEETLKASATGLDITVLRLGCVYGPGGGWWTTALLNQMQRGKLILVNGGSGVANLIHVADVASVVACTLERAGPPYDVFNVTDGMPVSWRRYFEALEALAGVKATVVMSASEAQKHGRKWLHPSLLRRVFRKLSNAPIIYPLGPQDILNLASRAIYSNKKIADTLHFTPEYDLDSGMQSVSSYHNSEGTPVAR